MLRCAWTAATVSIATTGMMLVAEACFVKTGSDTFARAAIWSAVAFLYLERTFRYWRRG